MTERADNLLSELMHMPIEDRPARIVSIVNETYRRGRADGQIEGRLQGLAFGVVIGMFIVLIVMWVAWT